MSPFSDARSIRSRLLRTGSDIIALKWSRKLHGRDVQVIDQFVWLFMFCIFDGGVCDYETEVMPDFESCAEAQQQYAIDHADEDYASVCKREREIRA